MKMIFLETKNRFVVFLNWAVYLLHEGWEWELWGHLWGIKKNNPQFEGQFGKSCFHRFHKWDWAPKLRYFYYRTTEYYTSCKPKIINYIMRGKNLRIKLFISSLQNAMSNSKIIILISWIVKVHGNIKIRVKKVEYC